jgi:hypothetical protein
MKSTLNPNTTIPQIWPPWWCRSPLIRRGIYGSARLDARNLFRRGRAGGGWSKWFKSLNYLSYNINTSLLSNLDVIQCSGFNSDCDNHATGKIRREAHQPMERIGGFMWSHYIAPLGVCSRCIGPKDAMVIAVTVGLNTTQNTTFS